MKAVWSAVASRLNLYWLAAISIGGKYFWLLVLAPLSWVATNWLLSSVWGLRTIGPADVQNGLVATPLALLGLVLGVRIVAGEIRSRNLEIIYTVPGGCEKVWWAKLFASGLMLVVAGTLLALTSWMLTPFPVLALYGSLQASAFYLVLAMGFSTLFRSEVGGGIASFAILTFNWMISQDGPARISPFFNSYVVEAEFEEVIAMTVQNRIGFLLVIAAIIALTFMRTNRRERMLGA